MEPVLQAGVYVVVCLVCVRVCRVVCVCVCVCVCVLCVRVLCVCVRRVLCDARGGPGGALLQAGELGLQAGCHGLSGASVCRSGVGAWPRGPLSCGRERCPGSRDLRRRRRLVERGLGTRWEPRTGLGSRGNPEEGRLPGSVLSCFSHV